MSCLEGRYMAVLSLPRAIPRIRTETTWLRSRCAAIDTRTASELAGVLDQPRVPAWGALRSAKLEPTLGIEPRPPAYRAGALPLCYIGEVVGNGERPRPMPRQHTGPNGPAYRASRGQQGNRTPIARVQNWHVTVVTSRPYSVRGSNPRHEVENLASCPLDERSARPAHTPPAHLRLG